jgi:hypothetical protein
VLYADRRRQKETGKVRRTPSWPITNVGQGKPMVVALSRVKIAARATAEIRVSEWKEAFPARSVDGVSRWRRGGWTSIQDLRRRWLSGDRRSPDKASEGLDQSGWALTASARISRIAFLHDGDSGETRSGWGIYALETSHGRFARPMHKVKRSRLYTSHRPRISLAATPQTTSRYHPVERHSRSANAALPFLG